MGRFDTDTAADEDVPLRQVVTAAGRTIYRQGSAAFQAFYIEEGRVEVSIEEGSQTITLCELGPGDLFGDIGVLTSELHKTTVTALENTTVSVLKKEDLTARLQGVEDKYIQALIKTHLQRQQITQQAYIDCYRHMTDLQLRMMGVASTLGQGVSAEKRQAFSEEVLPYLDAIQKVLEKHKN